MFFFIFAVLVVCKRIHCLYLQIQHHTMYEVYYNGRMLYVSNYFYCRILPK